MIFENSPNNYVVKVADFGYSTWFARDTDLVKMPRSQYWVAPEWHHRGFSRAAAVKMDIYSFGMLCLWLLCFKSQENTDNDFYGYLASARTLVDLAHEAITAMIGLEEQKRRDLSQLFDLTLAKKPAERSSNFNQLIPLCIPLR